MSLVSTHNIIQGIVTMFAFFLCKDGTVKVNKNVLHAYTDTVSKVMNSAMGDCCHCREYISLPDFSVRTLLHYIELLTTGEMYLTQLEWSSVISLQNVLDCKAVTRVKQLRPSQGPGSKFKRPCSCAVKEVIFCYNIN